MDANVGGLYYSNYLGCKNIDGENYFEGLLKMNFFDSMYMHVAFMILDDNIFIPHPPTSLSLSLSPDCSCR